MRWRWMLTTLLMAAVVAKKKHRHQKPGRALLDRLSSTTLGEVTFLDEATLLPAPLDVAPYSRVEANATCPHQGAEEFCRDTPGKRVVVCEMCEGLDGSSSRRHPASYAIDGDSATWWQSPTLAAGDFEHVEFVALLPDKMELLHVIIKSGPSPRPLAWSLEVSSSEGGEDWRLIKAFGDKDHCKRLWDLRPERRRRKARAAKTGLRRSRTNRADKATCSTQFASPRPLENGEMHVGIGEGISARRVRISFRAAHPAPQLQQYYTIRSLTLAARCLCHGHAQECLVTDESAKCSCLHGTCGSHCQRCCSGGGWSPRAPCPPGSDTLPPCSCGERGACAYDDTGAILCVNCTENRAGPLCDRCLIGYYNAVPDGPCLPCNCDPDGSDGSCTWDKRAHEATCTCRPGYTGVQCDTCEDPLAVFPICQLVDTTPACKCDPRGVVDPERICDDVCECKANVVGERCDACAAGHFGLSESWPEGCRRCYCSHIAHSCAAAPPTDQEIPASMVIPLLEGWLVTDAEGNETLEPSLDDQGRLYLVSYEVEGWESFYWVTRALSGEQLLAYSSDLVISLFWGIVRGDTGGNPTVGPDVILVGADDTKLSFGNRSHNTPGQLELVIPIIEGEWYKLSDDSTSVSPVTRTQLMDVLRDLKAIMIRAHFHGDQDEVHLESVEVRAGVEPREQCACPPGYSGAHCERCAWTHARVLHATGVVPHFECVPCNCNGHAGCETVDGPCGQCQHNTTGPHCERCLPGHYGNPVTGSCSPCACPLYEPANNFSPNCALASAQGDEFVCTQCPDGYSGDHCEHCDVGYHGSPTSPGGRCLPCACGGAPCHPRTGLCLTCPPNTEGALCDQCKEGYLFGPESVPPGVPPPCIPCKCGAGALSPACDARIGQCACRAGWAGLTCDTCDTGHGGIEWGCPVCRCGTASPGAGCAPTTGECECAPGAAPPHCDTCLPMHYGLDVTGCLGCNCSTLGAESNACDIRTGQCRCKPHVTGRACDTCEEGYWGLGPGGCRRCACGAGAAACDPVTGACACAPGVGGAHCNVCLPGYYGFGPAGCLQCPTCTDGKVCSPETGRCVCPARSHGPGCRQCSVGYHARAGSCQPCRCGPGAASNTCDPTTGQCRCRPGWAGLSCDTCAQGHFGPRCRPCDCSTAGTICNNGTCACDELGRCPCKENVVGDKCDTCLDGTFGLSPESPSGCTACFCFGRTARCTQAAVTRAALHAAAPQHLTLIVGDTVSEIDQDSLLAIHTHSPDVTISLPWPPVPVYMELDKRFLGDRVTSYGGMLRFKVEEEGGTELDQDVRARFPLVRLYGRHIVLDYHERVPPVNGTHAVRLQESLWSVRTRRVEGAGASRSALMLALQQLDRVLLRVTTRAPTRDEHVHALLLNVSLDTAIPGLSRSEPALGVEMCDCPRGYSAPSCQQPAVGFWIPPQKIHLNNVAGTIVINLESEAQPCHCNNRATHCDPVTGDCLNCSMGTGGPRCAVCAPGYHGAPSAPGGCQPCPCPSRARNFASACAMHGDRLQCLCKPGYTGPECESCAPSYIRASDGSCAPCNCGSGAVSAHCDTHGRCRCRPYATGDKCDRCVERRTFLDDNGCTPCDNCTQTLLDSIESLTSDFQRRADPATLSKIPKPYPALRQFSHNYTTLKAKLDNFKNNKHNYNNITPLVRELEGRQHRLSTEVKRMKEELSRREKEAEFLSLETMSGLEEVLKQKRLLGEQVGMLDEFARGERHLNAHKALKEAKHLLRQIKEVKLIDFIAGANDVFDSANLQSTSIQEHNYRLTAAYSRVRKLHRDLERWESKADELAALGGSIWAAGDTVAAAAGGVRRRLAAVREQGGACRLMLEDITNLSPQNLTQDIHTSVLRSQALSRGLPALTAELTVLTRAAEEKEGILYNLTPKYREKYLKAVEEHVAKLGEKAKEYKSLFAGTRAVASAGVSAARAWSDVASAVRNASASASAAAAAAATALNLARGPVPMTNTAEVTKVASEDLKRRGAEVLAKAEELRTHLEHLRRNADLVSVVIRGLGWQERDLGLRPQAAVADTLTTANDQADRVFATTRVLYDEASELRRRVRYNLRRQLAELQRHGDTALGAAQEHVSQIRGNTERSAELATALAAAAAARAKEHNMAAATISPALAALKHNIARAKHAADSISVSLTSVSGASVGCARAYPLPSSSAAVTRVAIAVSFDSTVRNGPLLYLLDDTQETQKHMKLSVDNQQVKVSWDLGGGTGEIVHPEVLQPAHDDGDHTAYRIELQRVWNSVQLTVERAGGNPITATNSSSPNAATLRTTQLWLGSPSDVTGLPGCVHALYSDDKTIGLWNFVKQPKEAKCTGCTQRWYGRSRGDPLVWFNGAGYAELRRSGLRPSDRRQFSLAFTFKTRDEDALLFMALDTANNRSVSVWIRSCRVVFRVEYSDSLLEITASGRHCTGRPAHVQAIRVFAANKLERGSLRVNGEETLGSPSPPVQSGASLPDLSTAAYWVGGVPPGGLSAPPLLGCVGALTVDREGYDILDTPTRHGVEARCGSRTLRSATLEGRGYMELPSPPFRRKAAWGVSFTARSSNGLLLFRTPSVRNDNEVDDEEDGDDKHYLALVLVEGDLELIAAAGKAETRLKTNGTKYDDGALHTVRIVRAHKQLELWVDESLRSHGTLSGNAYTARSHGLFIGGIDQWDSPTPTIPTQVLVGTVTDFINDAELISLENAVRSQGARLGRADTDLRVEPRSEPRELQAQPDGTAGCTKSPSYTVESGAVKFGDAADSYAVLRLPRGRDLALSLQFRTFAHEALLLFAPGTKAKPKHYLALLVREGKLQLVVRGRKRRQLGLTAFVADGTWRSVSVRVSRGRVVLSSGGAAASGAAGGAVRAPRVYVGGVPTALRTSNTHLPAKILQIPGLVGCIRRVLVSGRAEDLVRDARQHHAVGQCFPNVELGAYFAGDSYATWSGSTAVDSALEVRLQFRSAEPQGVLLATSEFVLELRGGTLTLSRLQPPANTLSTSTVVCDNSWHVVQVVVSGTSLALDVDAGGERAGGRGLAEDAGGRAPTPLYVGGVAEGTMDTIEGRENFKGCIRDLTIGGHKLNWTSMETLHNVLLDSCPVV